MSKNHRHLCFIFICLLQYSDTFPSSIRFVDEDIPTLLENFKSSGGVTTNEKATGYNFSDDVEKAILGEYDINNQDAYRNEDGSRKKDHTASSLQFSDKNLAVKGLKGEKFAIEGKFDKGSKTTGYHNVHHKEEYKKNRQFYDVAQKTGSYRRYGDFGAVLLAAEKDAKSDVKVDEDHRQLNYGKRGRNGSGSLYEKLQKYGAGNGHGQFYTDNLKFFDIAQKTQN